MDIRVLFGTTLIGLFLAFATCDLVVQRTMAKGIPINLRSGGLGALVLLCAWMGTNLTDWALSPRAIQALLAGATSLELSMVWMLVISWIVLPGFVLGLVTTRCWQAWYRPRTKRGAR